MNIFQESDITTIIAKYCDIPSVICLTLVSKQLFSNRREIVQNNDKVKEFDKLYGNNTFIRTLFGGEGQRIYEKLDIFVYDTMKPKKMENTIKILTYEYTESDKNPQKNLLNTMLDIFQEKINKEFDNNPKEAKRVKKEFLSLTDTFQDWNKSNMNMCIVYYVLYINSKNYAEMFNLFNKNDITTGMIFQNVNDFKKILFYTSRMLMKLIDKYYDNNFLRISFIFILFQYIGKNIETMIQYKDDMILKEMGRIYLEKVRAVPEVLEDLEGVSEWVKHDCITKLDKVSKELKEMYT